MAIYTQKCNNEDCEMDIFEHKRPMDEYNAEVPCPQCTQITEKLMTMPSFQLKGDGWFAQGYQKMTPVGNMLRRSDSAK